MRALSIVVVYFCGCHAPSNSQVATGPEEADKASPQPKVSPPKLAGEEKSEIAPLPVFPNAELQPYFMFGKAALAQRLYRRQQYPESMMAIEEALATAEGEDSHRLRILLATVKRDNGGFSEAATLYANAAVKDELLADYLHYEAAQAFAAAGDPKAGTHAAMVKADGPWGNDVEFLLAGAARAEGKHQSAIAHYRRFIESSQGSPLLAEARYHLGAELRESAKPEEGKKVWRKLAVSAPVSSWAALVKTSVPGKLSGSEHLERGMGYFVAMRNLLSEKDFVAAIRKSDLSAEERCQALFHRAKSVYKERKYGRSAPLFEPAVVACNKSGNTNYEVKSSYQAGMAYSRSGDHEGAIAHFAYVEKYPEHSYADDARLRQAEEHQSLKQHEKVAKLLSTLPAMYPEGDMRGEALWRLARLAYQRGNYKTAVSWLRKQIAAVPIEERWWAEGQAFYWLGRSLAHLGQSEKARQAYADCIDKYPLTYYSMQAFNRLREKWPEQYQKSVSDVSSGPAAWDETLRAREVYGKPAFRVGVKLARLGLSAPAKRQFAKLGFVVPPGRKAVRDAERIDWLIVTQKLLDLAGDYEGSHWIGRWHAIDYRRSWPNGADKLRWRLAYPLAFWELLKEFAGKYNYPPHLQMAIVREESAFDPSRESYANAIGLTQMIFPTAHDHSVGSGIAVTRENLKHPVKNVTIGSHFLESLQQAFDGRVGLMVPGYNAGRARVRGWIKTRSRYDLDEFIERIKGDQARRYTKRVLGSYFTYRYLEDQTVPVVRNEVPLKLSKLRKSKR